MGKGRHCGTSREQRSAVVIGGKGVLGRVFFLFFFKVGTITAHLDAVNDPRDHSGANQ